MTTITLPLTETQAVAIVLAAEAMGVEVWRMAVHVLAFTAQFDGQEYCSPECLDVNGGPCDTDGGGPCEDAHGDSHV